MDTKTFKRFSEQRFIIKNKCLCGIATYSQTYCLKDMCCAVSWFSAHLRIPIFSNFELPLGISFSCGNLEFWLQLLRPNVIVFSANPDF